MYALVTTLNLQEMLKTDILHYRKHTPVFIGFMSILCHYQCEIGYLMTNTCICNTLVNSYLYSNYTFSQKGNDTGS